MSSIEQLIAAMPLAKAFCTLNAHHVEKTTQTAYVNAKANIQAMAAWGGWLPSNLTYRKQAHKNAIAAVVTAISRTEN